MYSRPGIERELRLPAKSSDWQEWYQVPGKPDSDSLFKVSAATLHSVEFVLDFFDEFLKDFPGSQLNNLMFVVHFGVLGVFTRSVNQLS